MKNSKKVEEPKIDPRRHFVFHKREEGETPDVYVSEHHNFEDALFDFVFQTLGYAIIEVNTGTETSVDAKEV